MADIAVIGAGHVGGTLARTWSEAGHHITFGAREPGKPELLELAERIGARVSSVSEAIAASDVVLFAIPGAAMAETVGSLGAELDGKVAIDATNNIRGEVMHGAAVVTAVAPGASYCRAFNALGWEFFDEPMVDGTPADLFFCGPDGEVRETVERLIADVGLRPVWVGGPEEVDVVDGVFGLWLTLAVKRGLGRRLALKMIRETG